VNEKVYAGIATPRHQRKKNDDKGERDWSNLLVTTKETICCTRVYGSTVDQSKERMTKFKK